MKFREDGTFHILQFADIQELPEASEDTMALIRRALDTARPDLVVLTGDQLKGYSRAFRKKPGQTEKAIRGILEPIVSRGIPFAVTFGNHDRQSGMSNEEQMGIYRRIPGCVDWLNSRGQEILHGPEEGTFAIGIQNFEETKTVMAVYLLDSQGDAAGGGCQTLHPKQIYWYKAARDTFAQVHGGLAPGIVFQHIPMPEYYRLLRRVDKKTRGAIRTYRTHANEYYLLDEEKCDGGSFREAVSAPDNNAREFESLREKGDIFAVYCGHDHRNSFVGNWGGIDLGYTPSCGFHDYGDGVSRAVRELIFHEENPADYETRLLTYKELVGSRPSHPFRDFVYSHISATREEALEKVKKYLLFTGLAIAVVQTLRSAAKKNGGKK